MDKRYQVFVSSTYADLREERQAVIKTVIEADCIPAGMELFPAADEEQLTFIKRIIDDCDYYLLIIGGRYGSVTETGISYTEQEYDYAVEKGLKVIALIHGKPEDIPWGKSEQDPVLRERLQKFKDKVSTGRLVKFWKDSAELPGLVALSLVQTMKMFPAVGWVRANKAANVEVLGEINVLRKMNEELRAERTLYERRLHELTSIPVVQDLAGLDEEIKVGGTFWNTSYRDYRDWSHTTTWRKIFGYLSPYLVSHPNAATVKEILKSALFKASRTDGTHENLDDQDFQTIGVQLRALGLVNIEYTPTTSGGMGLFWTFTPKGERLMMDLRTVKAKGSVADDKSK